MSSFHDVRTTLSHSWRSHSPLAEQALARDIAECSDDDFDDAIIDDGASDAEFDGPHAMFRRPSGVAYGGSRPIFNPQTLDEPILTAAERKQSRDAERSLLRDNHVLPPKHAETQGAPGRREKKQGLGSRLYRYLFSTKLPAQENGEEPVINVQPPPTEREREREPLLRSNGSHPETTGDSSLDETWEQAVASGRLRTTWQRETKTIVGYSMPLIVTFLLQYSINVASIFAVGRIGRLELGAVSCKFFFWKFHLFWL